MVLFWFHHKSLELRPLLVRFRDAAQQKKNTQPVGTVAVLWGRTQQYRLHWSLGLCLTIVFINIANIVICEVGEWQHWLTRGEREQVTTGNLSLLGVQGKCALIDNRFNKACGRHLNRTRGISSALFFHSSALKHRPQTNGPPASKPRRISVRATHRPYGLLIALKKIKRASPKLLFAQFTLITKLLRLSSYTCRQKNQLQHSNMLLLFA